MADQQQGTDLICQWLGLPQGSWPPDNYTLLGLKPGETDRQKIEAAADQRISRLRPYQLKHAELATVGMNAVASALVTLTSAAAAQPASAAAAAPATGTLGTAFTRPAPRAPGPSPLLGGRPPTTRPPAPPPPTTPPPPILGAAFGHGGAPPSPLTTSPLLKGFPAAPLPRPNPIRPLAPVAAPPARPAPAATPPVLTAPAPGSPGSPIPPAPAPGTTSPGSVAATPTTQAGGLPDPLRVQIVGPLPLPVSGLGMGGDPGTGGMPSASPSWRSWTGGPQPVSGNRPGGLFPPPTAPSGRPSMQTVLQAQPGSPFAGVAGGAGGLPTPGMWGPFNQAMGQATRNLGGLSKAGQDNTKAFEKAGDALTVFGGPMVDRVRSMFAGTLGGAMAGYRLAGAPGAAAGAAAGFMKDTVQLGSAANPQSGGTWAQTGELAKTRVGGALGADIALDQMSADMQRTLNMVERDSWFRRQMEQRGGALVRGALPIALPGIGSLLTAGMLPEAAKGKDLAKPSEPGMKALPTIPGIGGAMGSAMSYEGFSQALGMSTMNMSQIELQTVNDQLQNINKTHGAMLAEIAESVRNVRTLRPAFR